MKEDGLDTGLRQKVIHHRNKQGGRQHRTRAESLVNAGEDGGGAAKFIFPILMVLSLMGKIIGELYFSVITLFLNFPKFL